MQRLGKYEGNRAYYTQQYLLLIAKAKAEQRGTKKQPAHSLGYCEEHHIVPVCCGGNDRPFNLVLLTAREHFVAHRLLCGMFPGSHKLKEALGAMCGHKQQRKLSSRQFEIAKLAAKEAKEALAIEGKLWIQSPEGRESARRSLLLRYETTDYRSQVSAVTTARNLSSNPMRCPETSAKAAAAMKRLASQQLLWSQSAEGRAFQSNVGKRVATEGKLWSQSAEGKAAIADRNRERAKAVRKCPHCCLVGRGTQMTACHGDNCKLLKLIGSNCLLEDRPIKWCYCEMPGCGWSGLSLPTHIGRKYKPG